MCPKWKLSLLILTFVGCARGGESTTPDANNPNDGGNPRSDADRVYASSKARLRFIGGDRYAELLAGAFALAEESLCLELGRTPCHETHEIALGGVEPYRKNVLRPLDEPATTSAIAVERMALAACSQAARRDLEGDGAGLLHLRTFDAAERSALTTRLYRALLARDPTPKEEAHLEEMASRLDASTWVVASCTAVSTTLEALFY